MPIRGDDVQARLRCNHASYLPVILVIDTAFTTLLRWGVSGAEVDTVSFLPGRSDMLAGGRGIRGDPTSRGGVGIPPAAARI